MRLDDELDPLPEGGRHRVRVGGGQVRDVGRVGDRGAEDVAETLLGAAALRVLAVGQAVCEKNISSVWSKLLDFTGVVKIRQTIGCVNSPPADRGSYGVRKRDSRNLAFTFSCISVN